MRDYITNQFFATLKEAADNCSKQERILLELGKSYVLFFYENPLYYQFLFSLDNIDVETYAPFVLFKRTAEEVLKNLLGKKADKKTIHSKVIALWSLVHGLSSVITIKGVLDTNHLEEEVELILGSISI